MGKASAAIILLSIVKNTEQHPLNVRDHLTREPYASALEGYELPRVQTDDATSEVLEPFAELHLFGTADEAGAHTYTGARLLAPDLSVLHEAGKRPE